MEIPRSTKMPLNSRSSQKRKIKQENNTDLVINSALDFLSNKKCKVDDAEDIFGKNVAVGLRAVENVLVRGYIKVKIQELIFQGQAGLIRLPRIDTASAISQTFRHPQNSFHGHSDIEHRPRYPPTPSPTFPPVSPNISTDQATNFTNFLMSSPSNECGFNQQNDY